MNEEVQTPVENEESSQEETQETVEETVEQDDTFDESLIDPDVRDYKPPVETDESDDELDEEEKVKFNKFVDKSVGSKVEQIQREMKVAAFFSENKEFSKYKSATEKYLSHPTYKNLPIQNIVAIVAAKDMQKIGAAKEREAQRKVAETKSAGSSVRKTSTESFNWATASKEEFEAQKAKVLGRQGI